MVLLHAAVCAAGDHSVATPAMSEDLHAAWARVDGDMRAVLSLVSLDPDDRRLVEEYLAHNELGHAFEAVVAVLAETELSHPADVTTHLAAAASGMHLDDNPDWRRVAGRGA
jgi:hypothetical protein